MLHSIGLAHACTLDSCGRDRSRLGAGAAVRANGHTLADMLCGPSPGPDRKCRRARMIPWRRPKGLHVYLVSRAPDSLAIMSVSAACLREHENMSLTHRPLFTPWAWLGSVALYALGQVPTCNLLHLRCRASNE